MSQSSAHLRLASLDDDDDNDDDDDGDGEPSSALKETWWL